MLYLIDFWGGIINPPPLKCGIKIKKKDLKLS